MYVPVVLSSSLKDAVLVDLQEGGQSLGRAGGRHSYHSLRTERGQLTIRARLGSVGRGK